MIDVADHSMQKTRLSIANNIVSNMGCVYRTAKSADRISE